MVYLEELMLFSPYIHLGGTGPEALHSDRTTKDSPRIRSRQTPPPQLKKLSVTQENNKTDLIVVVEANMTKTFGLWLLAGNGSYILWPLVALTLGYDNSNRKYDIVHHPSLPLGNTLTLGLAYNEFGYNEHLSNSNRFLWY